ncbi:hypothetical protein BOX30_09725 [Leptospirillum ferriphilum]|nr:hypothetical protein BOX30_09725 [Leptospirillum ferriphilum]
MIGSVLRPILRKTSKKWTGSFFVPIRDYQARARSYEGYHRSKKRFVQRRKRWDFFIDPQNRNHKNPLLQRIFHLNPRKTGETPPSLRVWSFW